jgi:glycosyltransferase involved in cell wall biosynthesis
MAATRLWEDWRIRLVVTHRDGSVIAKIGYFVAALATFLRVLVFAKPTLVHMHMGSRGSFVRKAMLTYAARLRGVPVILHVHGSGFSMFYRHSNRPLQAMIRRTLTCADVVIGLGENRGTDLRAIAPQARVEVLPNAIRPQEIVSGRDGSGPLEVVFLGRVGERKGTFTLLDAWAKLDLTGKRSPRLRIAGDGEVERARASADELGIADSVTVKGWMSPEQTSALLDRADIFVLPSLAEGQPMAILEAMSRGVCVLSSPVGDIPEMIGDDCGVLVPPADVDALATALGQLLDDDARRSEVGNNGLRRVKERFDANVVAVRIDSLYREICR